MNHSLIFNSNLLSHILKITIGKDAFENIVGNGENAGYQHFLLFPSIFPTLPKLNFNFRVRFFLIFLQIS